MLKIPSEKTQESISHFLTLIDSKIQILEKKNGRISEFQKILDATNFRTEIKI